MFRKNAAVHGRPLGERCSCRNWARYALALLAGWLLFATAHARVILEISEDYVAIQHEASRMVSREKPYTARLPRIGNSDSYAILVGRPH